MRHAVKRQSPLVAAGQVCLVGENGPQMLGAAATRERRRQLDLKMNQQRLRGAESSARVASVSMAPPPRANTSASWPASRAMAARSRSRNAASPSRAKISGMVQPASAAITSSASTKLQPSRRASSGPTVLLPEPMKPVSTMRRGAPSPARLRIRLVISRHWFQYRRAVRGSLLPVTCSLLSSTITTAPAVISAPPTSAAAFSFSPSSSHAKIMTNGTLSLSSGATREAGPTATRGSSRATTVPWQSREREKKHGAAIERTNLAVLAQRQRDAPCKDHHHAGAQRRGQVRVNMLHAHLGQQSRGGGKHGGKQCPNPMSPAHGNQHTRPLSVPGANSVSQEESLFQFKNPVLSSLHSPKTRRCL